jgi:hypothetical protein
MTQQGVSNVLLVQVSTMAGTGSYGCSYGDAPAPVMSTTFGNPSGLCLRPDGKLLVCDTACNK